MLLWTNLLQAFYFAFLWKLPILRLRIFIRQMRLEEFTRLYVAFSLSSENLKVRIKLRAPDIFGAKRNCASSHGLQLFAWPLIVSHFGQESLTSQSISFISTIRRSQRCPPQTLRHFWHLFQWEKYCRITGLYRPFLAKLVGLSRLTRLTLVAEATNRVWSGAQDFVPTIGRGSWWWSWVGCLGMDGNGRKPFSMN